MAVEVTSERKEVQQSQNRDERLSARLAENLAALLNPYISTGLEHLPDNPPYIIAANHDVLRGDYTNMPYDGMVLNHWLRSTKGLSPYWVVKLSSDSALNNFGNANKLLTPIIKIGFKTLFDNTGQAVYVSPEKCKDPLQELIAKLQQGEVVCMCPTGSKYSQKVKAGILYLSQKAGKETSGIPIVPVRIHPKQKGVLRSRYLLEVKPPIHPTFATGKLTRTEIREYTAQLQHDLYGTYNE